MSSLTNVVKRAAMQAWDAGNPTDLRFGTVTNVDPLEITVTQKFVLPEEVLVVPEHLTNHTIDIGVIGMDGEETHQQINFYQGLVLNDRVCMIRGIGGQTYYILGRLYGTHALTPDLQQG